MSQCDINGTESVKPLSQLGIAVSRGSALKVRNELLNLVVDYYSEILRSKLNNRN